MNLNTEHIDDWSEFIERNDIDLSCPACESSGEITTKTFEASCRDCKHHWTTEPVTYGTAAENDIDWDTGPEFCPKCDGADIEAQEDEELTEGCEECGGMGYIEPMWNTIWDSGFSSGSGYPAVRECANVFAFDYDGNVWLSLSCCGMDCTPYLGAAWIEMFPDSSWLPEDFMVTGVNLTHGYVVSCVGEEKAAAIYKLMRESIESRIAASQYELKDLDTAEKNLAERGEGK